MGFYKNIENVNSDALFIYPDIDNFKGNVFTFMSSARNSAETLKICFCFYSLVVNICANKNMPKGSFCFDKLPTLV